MPAWFLKNVVLNLPLAPWKIIGWVVDGLSEKSYEGIIVLSVCRLTANIVLERSLKPTKYFIKPYFPQNEVKEIHSLFIASIFWQWLQEYNFSYSQNVDDFHIVSLSAVSNFMLL